MKKLCLVACVAFAGLAATRAKADFMVIRWKSGICQIWDNADGAPPRRPGKYVRFEGRFETWAEALASMNGLHTMGQCGQIAPLQRRGFTLFP